MVDKKSNKRKADEANLDSQHWIKLKVSDLKAELGLRGLTTTGNKAVLLSRLQDNDGGIESSSRSGTGGGPPVLVSQEDISEGQTKKPPKRNAPKMPKVEVHPTPMTIADGSGAPIEKLAKNAAFKRVKIQKTGWNAKKISELKIECKDRDISNGGGKDELVARLEDDDTEIAIVTSAGYVPRQDENAIRTGEKRFYPFQPRPDSDFKERYKKAKSERMIMLARKKGSDPQGGVNETFMIAGSQGSVYTTTIGTMYKCDCKDFKFRGIRCKHVVYALVVILKAPTEIASQKALLPCEITDVLDKAPITQELHFDVQEEAHPGVRKPVEGDCPICVFDFEPGEETLWCKGACGQNVHKACFEKWKTAKQGGNEGVKCVYCRTPWIEGGGNEGLSGLEAVMKSAPKVGWHKNIAHLDIYKNASTSSHD